MPTKDEIKVARESLGLSQAAAAKLADLGGQSRWAEYEGGARTMPEWRWDLFRKNIGLLPLSLTEAAKLAHDSSGMLWFRPASWKGTGNALRFSGDVLEHESRGASSPFSYCCIVGEWAVEPKESILSERGTENHSVISEGRI